MARDNTTRLRVERLEDRDPPAGVTKLPVLKPEMVFAAEVQPAAPSAVTYSGAKEIDMPIHLQRTSLDALLNHDPALGGVLITQPTSPAAESDMLFPWPPAAEEKDKK